MDRQGVSPRVLPVRRGLSGSETVLARDAVEDPKRLRQFAAETYDLDVPASAAKTVISRYKAEKYPLREYNLRLSLKWRILAVTPPRSLSRRPVANPNRINYPLDNYARQTSISMHSLATGKNEAGPWVEVARRHLEEIGGICGETHMLMELTRRV